MAIVSAILRISAFLYVQQCLSEGKSEQK